MNWRLKCLAHHLLPYAPRAAHRAIQRYVSGKYFVHLRDDNLAAYQFHVANLGKIGRAARVLEFGAGSHLLSALLLSAAGAKEVLAFDLVRIATVDQINHVIRQLRDLVPGDWREIADLETDLVHQYRIHYLAPADARNTGLPGGSVDFFCSTSTLEHIPEADIVRILIECKRLASPDARLSHIIDYHDHYVSADATIDRTNFYRYSDAAWKWFNPANHYQNRLRHSEYERIFAAEGFEIVESRAVVKPIAISRLHPRFQGYSDRDLMALNGYFLCRP
jgi:hypothetical protein